VFACVYKGGGHTELAHVLDHDAVVCCIKGACEVRVHDVYVFFVEPGVLHCHDDGRKGVVYVAVLAESVLLVAKNAVGFVVFRACIFD
jgi:hypothetical protein